MVARWRWAVGRTAYSGRTRLGAVRAARHPDRRNRDPAQLHLAGRPPRPDQGHARSGPARPCRGESPLSGCGPRAARTCRARPGRPGPRGLREPVSSLFPMVLRIRTPPSSSGLASRLSRAVKLGTTIVPGPPLVLGRRRRGREAARRGTWPAPRRTRPRRAGRLPVWGAAQGSPGRGGEAQGRLARHLFPVQVAVGAVEEDEILPLDIEDECLCVVGSAAPTPPRRKGCAGGRRRGWSWSPRPRRFKTNRRPRTGTKPTRGRGGEAGQVRVTRSSPASCSRSRR